MQHALNSVPHADNLRDATAEAVEKLARELVGRGKQSGGGK
ncbi:hypothetical protein [Pseudofrankia sp. BMG5.36]|nr:hypothetical protein [Pseudofrankia sp. BMG5.36]